MKGRIGTPCTLNYTRPYWDKGIIKLYHIDKLSPKARLRYNDINLYNSGKYSLIQICEIFEINRSTFYRWRKKYNSNSIQSLEDRSKKPHQTRTKVARTPQVEAQICQIRRKYPYFGKEKIKKILKREDGINISASIVGRILSQYRRILPNMKVQTKRIRTLKKKRIRLSQVKGDMQGVISEWLQVDTVELNLRFNKVFLFSVIDLVSRIYYVRAYQKATSFSARDFLRRLIYLHFDNIRYLQIDNGYKWEKHFSQEVLEKKAYLSSQLPLFSQDEYIFRMG